MTGLMVALVTAAPSGGIVPKSEEPLRAASTVAQAPAKTAEQPDEAAIRRVVDAFTKAYNAGDSKAIGALFSPDAEIISEDGTAQQGREMIEAEFSNVFKDHPKSRIEVEVKSIWFVNPTVAIEEGTSVVTHDPSEPSERSRYEVVHVKTADKWQMASARDLPDDTTSAEEQLKQLHWLIGDWVDESPDALVRSSYRWTDNHRFILGDFTVNIKGGLSMTGTQRIGWDPLAKTIRSWVFDSEGGFVEGSWSRDGDQWIIKMTGVSNDGKPASSTSTMTPLPNQKHHMTWESRDRVVGGEKTPNIGPIVITREPPKPSGISGQSEVQK